MFAPLWTVNNSSYNTYYCDDVAVAASRLARAGGGYGYGGGASAGAFCLNVSGSASAAYANVGSRLMFL